MVSETAKPSKKIRLKKPRSMRKVVAFDTKDLDCALDCLTLRSKGNTCPTKNSYLAA